MTTIKTRSGHKARVIVVHESVSQSLVKDLITVTLITAMAGVGHVLGIEALEWIGGFMGLLTILAVASRNLLDRPVLTIEDARRELDRLETQGLEQPNA